MCPWPTWTGRSTTRCPTSSPTSSRPGAGCACGSTASWSTASSVAWTTPPTSPASCCRWRTCRPASPCSRRRWPALAAAVADRYAGTLGDVLRLALPPRRAAAEKRPTADPARAARRRPDPAGFGRYPAGPALLTALAEGAAGAGGLDGAARARTGPPGWPSCAAARCPDGGARSSSSPTARTSTGSTAAAAPAAAGALVHRAARRRLARRSATASSSPPPAARPRWCSAPARRCSRRCATSGWWSSGTTATTCTPNRARRTRTPATCWCSAPGWTDCAASSPGTARTAEAALLVESGWAHELVADRAVLRAAAPRVQALGRRLRAGPRPRRARRPGCRSLAHEAAREALAAGARCWSRCRAAGYVPSLACARCRAPGPLRALRRAAGHLAAAGPGGARIPACRWCARPAATFDCPHCHGTQAAGRRGGGVPHGRGAGAGLPGATVRTSGSSSGVLADGAGRPGARGRHPGRGAGRRGRLRRGAAARLLGAARARRPAGGGGDAAPLAQRRRARAARRRRRPGRGRGRRRAPRRPGAGALGPGLAGRARAGRPARARLPAGHPDRRASRGRPPRWPSSSRRCGCPRAPTCSARCPSRRGRVRTSTRERYLVRVPRSRAARSRTR